MVPVETKDFDEYLLVHGPGLKLFMHNHEASKRSIMRRRSSLPKPQVMDPGNEQDALVQCFNQVPGKYFEPECQLGFEDENRNSHAAYLFQEQLSGWLDQVEVSLWRQTTSQAHKFFNTLSDLNHLNSEVKDACADIATLRAGVNLAQHKLVENHLKIVQLKRKEKNMNSLQNIVAKIRDVRLVVQTVDSMVSSSQDYGGALSLIQMTRTTLKTELDGIQSLRVLLRKLNDFEEMIVDQLRKKFISLSLTWIPGEEDEQPEIQTLLDKLLPIIHGLVSTRGDNIRQVISLYRIQLIQDVKECAVSGVSQALAEMKFSVIDDETRDQYVSSVNAAQLRKLEPAAFLNFLEIVFSSLEMTMVRTHQVHSAFLLALDTVTGESKLSQANLSTLKTESQAVVSSVCDLSQKSVLQLMKTRNEINENLSLADFKKLFTAIGGFSVRTEQLSDPSTSLELRGALRLQSKGFLAHLHEKSTIKLNALLDEEPWKNVDVPFEIQAVCKRISTGQLLVSKEDGPFTPSKSKSSAGTSAQLNLMGKSYRAISTVLFLLEFIEMYLSCSQHLVLATACLPHLTEILRLFNERTNKLVLHAEATRTAGLKQISTRNLALASQALSIIIALIPSLEQLLTNSLIQKSKHYGKDKRRIELELEQLMLEFQSHRQKIFHKFTQMLEILLLSNECCGAKLLQINWDARNSENLGKPHDYIVKVSVGLQKMHALLQKYLLEDQLDLVFQDVFQLFNQRIPEIYSKVEPKTATGRTKVRIDINHLISALRRLRGTSGPGDSLEKYVMDNFGSAVVNSPRKTQLIAGPIVENLDEAVVHENQHAKVGIAEELPVDETKQDSIKGQQEVEYLPGDSDVDAVNKEGGVLDNFASVSPRDQTVAGPITEHLDEVAVVHDNEESQDGFMEELPFDENKQDSTTEELNVEYLTGDSDVDAVNEDGGILDDFASAAVSSSQDQIVSDSIRKHLDEVAVVVQAKEDSQDGIVEELQHNDESKQDSKNAQG